VLLGIAACGTPSEGEATSPATTEDAAAGAGPARATRRDADGAGADGGRDSGARGGTRGDEVADDDDADDDDADDDEVIVLDASGDGAAGDRLGPGTLDRSLHERFNHAGFAITVTHLRRVDGTNGRSLVSLTLHAEHSALAPSRVSTFRLRTRSGLHSSRYQAITAETGRVLIRVRLLFDLARSDATADALDEASLVVGAPESDQAVVPVGEHPRVPTDRHPVAVEDLALTVPVGRDGRPDGELLVSQMELGASVSNPAAAAEGMRWLGLRYEVCLDGPPVTVDPVLVMPRGRRLQEQVHLLDALSSGPKCPIGSDGPAGGVGLAYWQVPVDLAGTTPRFELRGAQGELLASFTLTLPSVPQATWVNQLPRLRR
jgi:hypothetical protein